MATSTLELGIDVGDLDRVIQIDAPNTVASFLQRLGRSGRRVGQSRNCLFLAASSNGLLRACAIVQLWRDGFVEPVEPPAEPLHVLAQQLMALALQLTGLGIRDWRRWLGRLPPFADLGEKEFQQILDHLLGQRMLFSDGIRLSLGDEAQKEFGRRHFMELLSVFTTPPLLAVLHGRRELGQVDHVSIVRHKRDEAVVLSLGGRSWRVQSIDWKAREVFVEPADIQGRSSWLGARRGVSYNVARRVHRLLTSENQDQAWSQRAGNQIRSLRNEYSFLSPWADVIVAGGPGGGFEWHTLSGNDVNQVLAQALDVAGIETITCDDFSIASNLSAPTTELESVIRRLVPASARGQFTPSAQSVESLKFSNCLPAEIVEGILRKRLVNIYHLEEVLQRRREFVFSSQS